MEVVACGAVVQAVPPIRRLRQIILLASSMLRESVSSSGIGIPSGSIPGTDENGINNSSTGNGDPNLLGMDMVASPTIGQSSSNRQSRCSTSRSTTTGIPTRMLRVGASLASVAAMVIVPSSIPVQRFSSSETQNLEDESMDIPT